MDEVEISGKRYISSRRAAKEHHYHSDYIGQLIRAKKIAGTKVGRAWYVDEESLKAYLHAESGMGGHTQPKVEPVTAKAPEYKPVAHLREEKKESFFGFKREPFDQPITIESRAYEPERKEKANSLRYVADEDIEPDFASKAPHMAKNVDTHLARESLLETPAVRKSHVFPIILTVVGLLMFAAAIFASAQLASTVTATNSGGTETQQTP